MEIEAARQHLTRTPQVLRGLLTGLPEHLARGNEGPESFSPFDVVGHLIDGEETDWIPRARIILAQGPDPRFAPYDRFRHQPRNAGRTLASLLDEFADLRSRNVATLVEWKLTPVQLSLSGIHPALGPATLANLIATWVVHDLGHVAQISRVLAKQYRDQVGPWSAYLPVLSDREAKPT
jgi:hypothetical protein